MFASSPSSTGEPLFSYWGKTDSKGQVHPALCHMIDVGQVAAAWLTAPTTSSWNKLLAKPFEGDTHEAHAAVGFLAAAHDIGKISPWFQGLRKDLLNPELHLRAKRATGSYGDYPHGKVGKYVLVEHLQRQGVQKTTAAALAQATGAHHGHFFPASNKRNPFAFMVSQENAPGWQEDRVRALDELSRLFGVGWSTWQSLQTSSEWVMFVSGLISVCDWIGSNIIYFPLDGQNYLGVDDYARQSALCAQRAADDLNLFFDPGDGAGLPFNGLFSFAANEMQQALMNVLAGGSAPALLLIEAPMGLGKTEAALWAARELLRREGMTGLYYALPTQATSNQMFGRLREFVEKEYKGHDSVDLHLLHGQSDFNEAYQELRISAFNAKENEDAAVARSWFTGRKRGLIAPFGVGTIDQALLGVLQVKHVAVRLFGLGSKVVVLDEVHAYDAYMSDLIERLLQWLAALGSKVILLSATLPAAKRRQLLDAFAKGGSPLETAAYPQMTVVDDLGKTTFYPLPGSARKFVTLARLEALDGDPFPGSSSALVALENALHDGGCAAWICNTVSSAQKTYALLKEQMVPGLEISLFHARFPLTWRIDRENAALERFSKKGQRPRKAVLVATQVIEQSLDLDFDFMVSELCPADLLLQRMGRLHRHERTRPVSCTAPKLAWVEPPIKDGVLSWGTSGYVYEPYILLRSWLALRKRKQVVLPLDIPVLVESVYGDEEPFGLDGVLARQLAEAQTAMLNRTGRDQQAACNQMLVIPVDNPYEGFNRELDDDDPAAQSFKAKTRLTEPSVTLVCMEKSADGTLRLLDDSPAVLNQHPTPDQTRALRLSSVSIQNMKWVQYFWKQPTPESWKLSGHLRGCKKAVFVGGVLDTAEHSGMPGILRLDPELGLVIPSTKEEKADV